MELTKQKRNYGIDLLRIVSMFMIVMLHSLGHGKALAGAETMSVNYQLLWLLECAAYCAVNCFALVSGYVGLGSRLKLSGIVQLWLQVFFYHGIFTVVWALLENRPLELLDLLPIRNNAYWYYTAYFGISFFMPLINGALEQLDKRTAWTCVIGAVLLYSVYPTLLGKDIFKIDGGYHALWLVIIYILGACIRKYAPCGNWGKRVWAAGYLAMVLVSWGTLMVKKQTGLQLINLVQYPSPTILLAAVCLLMLFSKLRTGDGIRKIIALVSPLTFGVYLIHDSMFIRKSLISGTLAEVSAGSTVGMTAKVFCFAAAVFVVCLAIDWLRSKLFQLLRVKEIIAKLIPQ